VELATLELWMQGRAVRVVRLRSAGAATPAPVAPRGSLAFDFARWASRDLVDVCVGIAAFARLEREALPAGDPRGADLASLERTCTQAASVGARWRASRRRPDSGRLGAAS
jgi:hypothetical protein